MLRENLEDMAFFYGHPTQRGTVTGSTEYEVVSFCGEISAMSTFMILDLGYPRPSSFLIGTEFIL